MKAQFYTTAYIERALVRNKMELEVQPDSAQEKNVVSLHPEFRFQALDGFGGAVTEAAAVTLKKLGDEGARRVLGEYFGANGIGYRLARVPLDSCDFSLGNYSASEKEDLSDFSIRRDEASILPVLIEANRLAGESLRVISPPGRRRLL